MGTKTSPGKYDCYANAKPDEPIFHLLARDASAPEIIRLWCEKRGQQITRGEKPESDYKMIEEAYQTAKDMETWRFKNWRK